MLLERFQGVWDAQQPGMCFFSLVRFFTDKSCRFSANCYQGPLKTLSDPQRIIRDPLASFLRPLQSFFKIFENQPFFVSWCVNPNFLAFQL